MTPEQLAAAGTEGAHQTALMAWAALNQNRLPGLGLLFHIANGDQRGSGTARSAAIAGGRLKAQGVRSGVPDLFLPVPRYNTHGLWIEMKRADRREHKDGGLSESQVKWRGMLLEQGYGYVVCYSWNEAAKIIEQYLK